MKPRFAGGSSKLTCVFAFLGVLLVTACRKQEGGTCKTNEQVCSDSDHALVCRTGTFVSVACPGPLKCSKFENHVNCDTTEGDPGETCMGEDDEFACSRDKKELVVCKKGKFAPYLHCRGAAGCAMDGRIPKCDVSLASRGDSCKKPEALACADNGRQMLVCQNGQFETFRYCRGEGGCRLHPTEGPACDESVSDVGDPCGTPGQLGCSSDGKNELVCQGGAFVKARTCKKGCAVVTRNGRAVDCK